MMAVSLVLLDAYLYRESSQKNSGHTDLTDKRTDISNYRVASLLKITKYLFL